MKKASITILCLFLLVGYAFAQNGQRTLTCVVGDCKFEMVHVKGGSFLMGCEPEYWYIGKTDEVPQHGVSLGSYYLGRYEVTQRLWTAVMGYNPSNFIGEDLPVEQVSYNEVQVFLHRLDSLTGLHFRLPTEAEWEYAARGGNESKGHPYAGSRDAMRVGWTQLNSNDSTHTVGGLVPNELGLYDMTGNVWEWCNDLYQDDYYLWLVARLIGIPDYVTNHESLTRWMENYHSDLLATTTSESQSQTTASRMDNNYLWNDEYIADTHNPKGAGSGSFRVGRGGSWTDITDDCRNAYRNFWDPDMRLSVLGFRLALSDDGGATSGWMPNQYVIDSIVGEKIYSSTTTATVARMSQGILEGLFSVAPGKQVRFSTGNLQYNAAANIWRFADRQFDIIGFDNMKYGKHYAGWIDLFAWGTSGYRDKTPYYYSPIPANFGNGTNKNIDGTSYDWGVYNRISNGGNREGQWRSLSVYEWAYILTGRPDAWRLRTMGQIEGTQGLVLLPDNWLARGFDTLDFNTIYRFTVGQWLVMERAGAVFLPAAGMCNLTEYHAALATGTIANKNNAPIEGYNVSYGSQIPMLHESVSTMAKTANCTTDFSSGHGEDDVETTADREFSRKANYAPLLEGSDQLGYYWTTIHYDKRQAMGVCFALGRSAYIMPLERLARCAVRLVQDVEPDKKARKKR